jgi:hypothetical protein
MWGAVEGRSISGARIEVPQVGRKAGMAVPPRPREPALCRLQMQFDHLVAPVEQ